MREYIIYNKMIIFLYCAYTYTEQRVYTWTILYFLLYIIFNFSIEISKNNKAKLILNLCSIILWLLFISKGEFNIFLIIVNIYDINYYFNKKNYIALIIIFILSCFIPYEIAKEFLVIALLSFMNFSLYKKCYKRIGELTEKNYNITQKNHNLNNQIVLNEKQENYNLYLSQLEERNKISQEIHDKIGHVLAGNIMQLEACKILMEKDKEKSEKLMEKSIISLREGLEEVRLTVRDLKPPREQLGLTKIETVINKFMLKTDIDTKLVTKGDLSLVGYKQWKIIQESLKECLTNIIKYSKATKVSIIIEELNKFIKFNIKDNGIGCMNIEKGIGIRGIEERCENGNAKLIIDGGDGFSLIILLPK
ncbi:sensor histidine kinase [Clostridium botulinum]